MMTLRNKRGLPKQNQANHFGWNQFNNLFLSQPSSQIPQTRFSFGSSLFEICRARKNFVGKQDF